MKIFLKPLMHCASFWRVERGAPEAMLLSAAREVIAVNTECILMVRDTDVSIDAGYGLVVDNR